MIKERTAIDRERQAPLAITQMLESCGSPALEMGTGIGETRSKTKESRKRPGVRAEAKKHNM